MYVNGKCVIYTNYNMIIQYHMSALLLTGLGVLGSYLNNNKKQPREQTNLREQPSTMNMPNGRNIYHSNRTQQVNRDILHQANDLYRQGENPEKTAVIPPFWTGSDEMKINHQPKNQQRPEKDPYNIIDPNEYKTLYREEINNPYFNNAYQVKKPFALDQTLPQRCENVQENFTHQNMVPFFKGSESVNTIDHDERQVELFTGQNIDRTEKREIQGLLFEPSKQNPWTTQPGLNVGLEDRYITSIYRTNEIPFEQTIVSKPTIYTDGVYRLHEKNVDELRARSKPKTTFTWDPTSGKNYVTRSGTVAKFVKYKPNRFRTQDIGDLIITTGSVIRPQIPEQFRPVHTYRTDQNIVYKGSLGPVNQQQVSNKQNTQYESAPTLKQTSMYSTGDQNPAYSLQQKGLTVYDPDDIRTKTLKESHIYETGDQNVHGAREQNGMTVYDPSDVNKRTLRELNMYKTGDQNVHGAREQNGMTVYDPDDVNNKTLKETHVYKTGDQNILGVSRQNEMTVYDPDDVQDRTLKEDHIYTTGDQGTRGSYRQDKLTVYDPDDIQGRTLKEDHMYTTGDQGTVSTNDQKGKGYDVASYTAYPTLKQVSSNHQYSSHGISNNPRRRIYEAEESLHINGLKGLTNVYRTPTQNGDKKPLGVEGYNIRTPKPIVSWNKRVERNRSEREHEGRVIPQQRMRREDVTTVTRFMPEMYDIENTLAIPINRPVLDRGTELYQLN